MFWSDAGSTMVIIIRDPVSWVVSNNNLLAGAHEWPSEKNTVNECQWKR